MARKTSAIKRRTRKAKATDWTGALSQFLDHMVTKERSANTIKAYRADLLAFTAWYQTRFAERPVPGLVLPEELREWKSHMRDRGQQPASINRRLAALAAFFKWAEAAASVPPVEIPRSLDQVAPPPHWLEERDQRALCRELARHGSKRDQAVVYVLMDAGLRVAELCALERRDIELGERSGKLLVREGKGRKQRSIELGPRARSALRAYLLTRHDENPAVFLGKRGPIGCRAVQYVLDRLAHRARIGDLSPHMLRHTFGHNLAAKGVALQVIADLMGHGSLDVTRGYVTPGSAERAAAVELLGGGSDD